MPDPTAEPAQTGTTTTSVSDLVVLHVQQKVWTGEFRPGSRVPAERTIAAQLSVSRTAVRDAFARLEQAGLLQRRHGSGTRIADQLPPNIGLGSALHAVDQRLVHSFELRHVLEPRVAAIAATRCDDHYDARLSGILRESQHNQNDVAASMRCDIAFHSTIALATGNPLLATITELTTAWTLEARVFSHRAREGRALSLAGHVRIAEALRLRDPMAAEAAMRAHLHDIDTEVHRENSTLLHT